MPGSLERSFFLYWITGEKHLEDRFQVGVITTTHGVRGEVKVFPTTDDVKRFKRLKKVILDTGKEEKILEVEGARFMKNLVLLKFKGYDSINDIEKYKGDVYKRQLRSWKNRKARWRNSRRRRRFIYRKKKS